MTFNLKQCALVCGALALAATSAAARTVVDANGTSVEIPDHVNRVVVTNILPLASAVTVFLNDGKTVVGEEKKKGEEIRRRKKGGQAK